MKILITLPRPARLAAGLFYLIFLSAAMPAQSQNVAIDSWTLPGAVRSADVRVRHPGTPAVDHFDPAVPEAVSVIKSENAIYVRFHNNSSAIVPDGTVTVSAEYAEASPGLGAADLPGEVAAVPAGNWNPFGSYVMDLEILPGDPPGYGLLPGAVYPTSREQGMPARYRIDCSSGCSQSLPTAFFLRVTLSLAGDTDPGDDEAVGYYDESGGTPPSDIVLLHDLSGSMAAELPLVKERAKFFLDLLNAGDRVGLVAFSTQFPGDTKLAVGLSPIVTVDPSDPTKSFAKTEIDTFAANGLTPMGAGVVKAQEVLNAALPPYPGNRAIVMLTDGRENRDPRLKDPPDYPLLESLNTDSKGPVALYPLWFGTVSHWGKGLLEDIVTQVDEGKLVDQPEDDLALAQAYLMIRGILTTDDIYAIHRGTAGDGYEGSIHVDSVTRELILAAAWRSFGREIDIDIWSPDDSSWQKAGGLAASTSRGALHVVHRISGPKPGHWRYRLVFEREAEPYVLSALADQVEILLQSSLADAAVAAGEPLEIRARLSRRGKPVEGARVTAVIQVPKVSIGTLLAKARQRIDVPSDVPGQDPTRANRIVKELRKIHGEDLFRHQPARLSLSDPDGDGTYVGHFKDTKVSGTYRISVNASGGRGGERFERHHEHAAVVGLGPVDPKRSRVEVDLIDRSSRTGAGIWRVLVTPMDVYGNAAAPGYADRIRVEAGNGRWLKHLEDNQDGSYARLIEVAPRKSPKLDVSAFGRKLKLPSIGRKEFEQTSKSDSKRRVDNRMRGTDETTARSGPEE